MINQRRETFVKPKLPPARVKKPTLEVFPVVKKRKLEPEKVKMILTKR